MRHTILQLFFAISVMLLYNGCSHKDCGNKKIQFKCFSFDLRNRAYNNCLIEISTDSMLTVYTGETSPLLYKKIDERFDMTLMRNPFLRKINRKMIRRLTSPEYVNLKHAFDDVRHLTDENIPKYYGSDDTWKCIIVIENNQYIFDELTDRHEAVKNMLAVIDSLSPVRLYFRDSSPIYQ